MTKKAYDEMITALERREIGIVHHKYTWRSFGSWEIVVDTTPRRKVIWNGHRARLDIENTIDGDPVAYWNYRIHWEGPEGYSPRTEAVVDALLSQHNPRLLAFDEEQRLLKETFERNFEEQLEEVPGFGGDAKNPALRAYLLGSYVNQFNFAERQLAKVGDLIGAMRGYELRVFRYVAVSSFLAFIWAGFFGVDFTAFWGLVGFGLLTGASMWQAARKTRIGLVRLAADVQAAPKPQAQPAS